MTMINVREETKSIISIVLIKLSFFLHFDRAKEEKISRENRIELSYTITSK